jgi:hypothetical protein
MPLSKEQIGRIIGIVLAAALALLSVFGYDVTIVQPRELRRAQEVYAAAAGGPAVGGPAVGGPAANAECAPR